MKFKHGVLLVSFVAAAAITGTAIYFLSEAAAEAERARQAGQAESDCAEKVPAAIDVVQKHDSVQGARIQVTGSTSHFNRRLKQCLVEVSTFEHLGSPVYVKTMVNMATRSLVLWSLAGDSRGSIRNCFAAKSTPIDCGEADKQWTTLMYE